jgi:hypothetical protein
MYDGLNRIRSSFGDGIEYWDISFIQVWDNSSNGFAAGYVGKLFNSLPESVSVGNASFAKNSPYIIVFDFIEEYFDNIGVLQTDYRILAANIEAGYVNQIYENTTLGYPSYSRQDDKILFTYDEFGDLLLARIDIQPGDKTLPVDGTDFVFITGAQKGVWFQTGSRIISAVEGVVVREIQVYPQPAIDVLNVQEDDATPFTAYRLIEMTGRVRGSGELTEQTIYISLVTSGYYILQLEQV